MRQSVHWVLRVRLESGEMVYFEDLQGDFAWTTPCRQDAKAYFDVEQARAMLRVLREHFRGEPTRFGERLKVVRVTVRR